MLWNRLIEMPMDYHCPFCPNHEDKDFYESRLAGQPICEGCFVELYIFSETAKRRDDKLIDDLEKLTGLSWRECCIILLEDKLAFQKELQIEPPEWWKIRVKNESKWTQEEAVEHLENASLNFN